MAKRTGVNSFLKYASTERPDIYQTAPNTWTSIVQTKLMPSHLLSSSQGAGLISNFMGLLNGTLSGDPNPSLTLQFVVIQYPSSFSKMIERYNKRAEALANAGRSGASDISWAWYKYLSSITNKDLFQRQGGIAISVRPIQSLLKRKNNQLGEIEAFKLLDDTVSRVMNVTQQIQWGGNRLSGDDLVAFLSFWAMGEMRRPKNDEGQHFAWEV